jgi:hypothetical protein
MRIYTSDPYNSSPSSPARSFQPRRHGGLRPFGEIAAELVSNIRRQRQLAHLHGLGERAVAEFASEFAARVDAVDLLDEMLADYCRLDAESLRTVGGDQMPGIPLRRVG